MRSAAFRKLVPFAIALAMLPMVQPVLQWPEQVPLSTRTRGYLCRAGVAAHTPGTSFRAAAELLLRAGARNFGASRVLRCKGGGDAAVASREGENAMLLPPSILDPAEEDALETKQRGRQSADAMSEAAAKKLAKLNTLLQRAAAYSTFLRERLQQSQSEAEASAGGRAANSSAGEGAERDPRQPALVTGAVMRPYQVDGVQWLISLYENGLNGMLADEMGLGKTLQVIAFLAHLWEKRVRGPFLVVAPLSTIGNWQREFARFAPDVPVVLYHGTRDERAALRRRHFKRRDRKDPLPVIITSFEIAMNDAKVLAQLNWKYLTVDEGHRLKNKDCKLLRELKALHAANRLLLSGTPLQNNLTELWSAQAPHTTELEMPGAES
jgi:ATP-dependent DNA helicase